MNVPSAIPSRAIVTDDPFWVKLLVSHHLEYAEPAFEQNGLSVQTGSYHGVGVAVARVGRDWACLSELKRLGAKEVFYMGVTASEAHPIKALLLAEGGDSGLLVRAQRAALRCRHPVEIRHATEHCHSPPDIPAFYKTAEALDLAALAFLTVEEHNGIRLEDSEWRSRFYPMANLVFEQLKE